MELMQKQLLSHEISPKKIEDRIKTIAARIKEEGDKPYVTVSRQLELLSRLSEFDFGRHLLQNQGINGYWTHYMLTHPWYRRKTGENNCPCPLTELERFILERAPSMLATQQRFEIFLEENQKYVNNNAKLASIPCGMMGELLYLNYAGIDTIQLMGIDYDYDALKEAKILAKKQGYAPFTNLIQKNAWDLDCEEEFDLISSNGLNIYEQNEDKVVLLYHQFYKALKIGGKLVTSFLTLPPSLTTQCEWDMSRVNQEDLLLQKIIFVDIIDAKWQCYRSTEQTYEQLTSVGFDHIEFIYDDAKIFPTVIAMK